MPQYVVQEKMRGMELRLSFQIYEAGGQKVAMSRCLLPRCRITRENSPAIFGWRMLLKVFHGCQAATEAARV